MAGTNAKQKLKPYPINGDMTTRIVSITKQNYLTIKHTNMEASEVGNEGRLWEDFCQKFLELE